MARAGLLPPRAAGRGTARDVPPVVFLLSRKIECREAPSHHPGDTRVRAQAGDGVDPRRSAAAVATAQADREFCHAHAGMGAWMSQHLGGVHACLTTAGVARRDEHKALGGLIQRIASPRNQVRFTCPDVEQWSMPSRASKGKKKRPRDANVLAYQIVQEATGQAPSEEEKPDTRNPAAVALSKLGASKGGKARAIKLSNKRRIEIAKKAAKARWGG